MKKIFSLIVLTLIAISCSNPEENATPIDTIDLTKLEKVIFSPETKQEIHWNFYNNGLLKEITKLDGTVIQTFIYDADQKLIKSEIFNPSGANQLFTFTYNANDFITSPNTYYDSILDLFVIGDVNSYHSIYRLNSEKLLTYSATVQVEYEDGVVVSKEELNQVYVTYQNNNITNSYANDVACNYYSHDDKINPLRNATLPICRAFNTINYPNNKWISGLYNSSNNVLTHNYCLDDPESETYEYEYNSNNLPFKSTLNWYYLGVLEYTKVYALYYYQSDVIPK